MSTKRDLDLSTSQETVALESPTAFHGPVLLALAVALLGGGVGSVLCFEAPRGFEITVATWLPTLAALGLWVLCRQSAADTPATAQVRPPTWSR